MAQVCSQHHNKLLLKGHQDRIEIAVGRSRWIAVDTWKHSVGPATEFGDNHGSALLNAEDVISRIGTDNSCARMAGVAIAVENQIGTAGIAATMTGVMDVIGIVAAMIGAGGETVTVIGIVTVIAIVTGIEAETEMEISATVNLESSCMMGRGGADGA